MLSVNNNYDEREKKVLELYDQGKSTRDIAKEQRMSLRDISIILRKNHVSHRNVITNGNDNSDNNNDNSYKLFSEGKKPFEVAIELRAYPKIILL